MSPWLQHLPVLPIVLPLFAGASMLLIRESRRKMQTAVALLSTLAQVAIVITLLTFTTDAVSNIWSRGIGVYSIGGWPAPFGIVLVVDRLSALMLLLGAVLGLCATVYSFARWERVGVHYQPLFQFLLMGVNGAFLAGDIFNLFVFFEVMLASSYGLLLHGSGAARVKAGLHYIVVNLVASLVFLLAAALIYGVAGTLNMAELGLRVATLDPLDRGLFETGAGLLGVVFLIKAGAWPVNFWLPNAYSAAGAPVAAVFSILTKLGVYAVLRIGSLFSDAGMPGPLAGEWLFYAGIATLIFGIVGVLGAQHLGRVVAHSVIASSGTVLTAFGLGSHELTAPALFYLVSSVFATGAFFMLTGMTERTRIRVSAENDAAPLPAVTYAAFGELDSSEPVGPEDEIGIAIPAAMAFLGLAFVCCVILVTGMPPLSGFLGKFALLSAALSSNPVAELQADRWALIIAVLATTLAGLIALTRIGMRLFWTITARTTPRLRVIEAGPVALLVLLCIALTVFAESVMTYLQSTADALHTPQIYIRAVLSSKGGITP